MSLLSYLFRHGKLGIKRKDLVVEVGAGGDPFLRSDIIVEKFIDDDTERHTGLILDRPTVAADGSMLPFHDKSIDYIICSHVLEHIANPKPFLHELSRVAKRGLIISPIGGYERLHPKGGHLWYVWNDNGTLCLKQKKCWNEFPEVREYFRKVVRLPNFWKLWNKNYAFFNTIFEWDEEVNYRIDQYEEFDFSRFKKAQGDQILGSPDAKVIPKRQRVKTWVAKGVRPLISRHHKIRIHSIICCPLCKGNLYLSPDNNWIKCESCKVKFPVKRLIPRLLREEASFPNGN